MSTSNTLDSFQTGRLPCPHVYVICVLTEQANTFMLGMLLALAGSESQSHGSRGPHRVITHQWSLLSEVTGNEITLEGQGAIMQQFSLTSVTSLTPVTHYTRAHITSFVTMSRSITRNRLKGNCQPHARDPHHWR